MQHKCFVKILVKEGKRFFHLILFSCALINKNLDLILYVSANFIIELTSINVYFRKIKKYNSSVCELPTITSGSLRHHGIV